MFIFTVVSLCPCHVSQLSQECQFFLDSLEVDIRAAKSAIKRALTEADVDE
jgi:hypothetical protein